MKRASQAIAITPVVELGENLFLDQAKAVLSRLQIACEKLVREAPGGIRTAADFERALGVNKKIAWQVFKIAEAKDPLTVGTLVPGSDPMRRLLEAAAKISLPAPITANVGEAYNEFDQFVRTHAGDRASFVSMIGSRQGDEDASGVTEADRQHLRAAFRAASHFWGTQIDTRINIFMAKPHESGSHEFVSMRGRFGLRRLRLDAAATVDRHRTTDVGPELPYQPRPLDPSAVRTVGVPLLPAFSSKPLPELTRIDEAGGYRRIELAERQVGLQGAVDLMFGTVSLAVPDPPRQPGSGQHGFHSMVLTDMPTSVLMQDILVHRSFGDVTPQLTVYADPRAEDSKERRELSPVLPIRPRIEHLGAGPSKGNTADLPRYAELIGYTCGLLGWDADEFDVYRVRIEFPFMHSVVRLAVPLGS